MSMDSAHSIEHSSAEVVSIAENGKATHLRVVYVKSGSEDNLFCSVKSMACIDKTKVVLVDVAGQQNSRFNYSKAKVSSMFRVKLVDTHLNQVLSEVKVPGQFKGLANINESQVAVWLDGYEMILLKVGATLTAERSLKFNAPRDFPRYEVTSVSCYDDHVYVCRANTISSFNMKGKVNEEQITESVAENHVRQHFLSNAVYKDRNDTFMYTIVRDARLDYVEYLGARRYECVHQSDAYLSHGTGKDKFMDIIKIPGDRKPKSITMCDERELLFTILYNDAIYVLRAGTTDGRVLLSEDDGLRHVTAVSYCSKTRELFVAMEDSNYVNVYQLSGLP